jgi:hypothetical protein
MLVKELPKVATADAGAEMLTAPEANALPGGKKLLPATNSVMVKTVDRSVDSFNFRFVGIRSNL